MRMRIIATSIEQRSPRRPACARVQTWLSHKLWMDPQIDSSETDINHSRADLHMNNPQLASGHHQTA